MKSRMFFVIILGIGLTLYLFLITSQATKAENAKQFSSVSSVSKYADTSLESVRLGNTPPIVFTSVITAYLPIVMKNYPWPIYQWFIQQQNITTGLLPSQQDNFASTYNNALAVIVFTLKGDSVKAKKILDFFNNRAGEFFNNRCNSFNSPCSQTDPCDDNNICGFFESRIASTGNPYTDTNRWIGDMAWLLMAIHHYQAKTGDASYDRMAQAIVKLLKSFQQPDGHTARGWENGDSTFNHEGHAEGNLDAYRALSLYGETVAAQKVKDWLDGTDLDWKRGPLDLHSWRVLSLGKEYGFSLPDTERMDDESIRYKSIINYKGSMVTGFLPFSASDYFTKCHMSNNIWTEGTGGMAVAFYKAGYKVQGDFYVDELEKFLFKPAAFPDTQTISFLALPVPDSAQEDSCDKWVDTSEGHVAAVAWYIFAKERFDPFSGVVINSFQVANPIVKIETENYDNSFGNGIRLDGTGKLSEGRGLHLGGDDNMSGNNLAWVEYKFNVLIPIAATAKMRYADDVGGDTTKIYLDGIPIASIATLDTGTWNDYVITSPFSVGTIALSLHTLRIEVIDNGTFGLTVDYFLIDGN